MRLSQMITLRIYLIIGLFLFTPAQILISQRIIEYRFDNSFSSTDNSAPDLIPVCTGAFVTESINGCNSGAYHFDFNCGLQFDNSAASTFIQNEYTIEMYFKFEDLTSWKRIIDFKNRKSDNGLYGLDGRVDFWPITTSPTSPFSPNVFAHILVTREESNSVFKVYVDGLEYISFIDSGGESLLNNDQILSFFYDDPIISDEASPGTVSLIRLYDYLLNPDEVFDNFSNISNTTIAVQICPGQSHFAQGMDQINEGSYKDTILTLSGCDSVIVTNLIFASPQYKEIVQSICAGEFFMGRSSTGIYQDTITSLEGCTEITTINLTVNPVTQTDETFPICSGEVYKGYSASGIYRDTFSSVYGCDSIHTLTLDVFNNSESSEDLIICNGETFRIYNSSTVIVDTFMNSNGCDSFHTTNLIVDDLELSSLDITNTSCADFDGSVSVSLFGSSGFEFFTLNDSINNSIPFFNNLGVGNYSLLIENDDCLIDTSFSIVRLKCPIYIPNAISPNGDGVNDYFEIFTATNSSFTILSYSIYNRWGGMVYSFSNEAPLPWWDGTSNGISLESGTYIYNVLLLLEDGTTDQYSGDFFLIN